MCLCVCCTQNKNTFDRHQWTNGKIENVRKTMKNKKKNSQLVFDGLELSIFCSSGLA
jgi:hypothetical protein